MKWKWISLLFASFFLITACTGNSNSSLQPPDNQSLPLSKLSANGMPDQQAANLAKQSLSEHEEVEAVRAVNDGEVLVIGLKLNHHDRIQMDKIEKKLQKKMRDNFSDMNVTLSTDQKIHLELQRFEEDLQANEMTKEQFNKRLQKIKKLSKEQT